MAANDSVFLAALVGKPVRIVAADEASLPPLPAMVLKEVSSLGVVVADSRATRFFPWHEIVEIHPAGDGVVAENPKADELVDVFLGVDFEP